MRFVSDLGSIDLLEAPARFDLSQLPEVPWDPAIEAYRTPVHLHRALWFAFEATGVSFADQVRAADGGAASDLPRCTVTPLLGGRGDLDPALLARLIVAGEHLPDDVCKRVLAAGPAAAPALVRVMESDALARADAPGEG